MSSNASNHRGRRRPLSAEAELSELMGRTISHAIDRRDGLDPPRPAGPQAYLPGVGFGPDRDGPYRREGGPP